MRAWLWMVILFPSWCIQPAVWPQQAPAPPAKPGANGEKAPPAKPAPPAAKTPAAPAKPPAPAPPPVPDVAKRTADLRALLDTRKVTLNIEKTPLSDVVRSLASLAKVNMVLDHTLPASTKSRPVTLSLRDATLRTALTQITRPDLVFEVLHEAVLITTKAALADFIATAPTIPEDLTPEGQKLVDAMHRKLISFSFDNARFQDAVSVLSQLTGVKIIIDPDLPANKMRAVNLNLTDVHLESALFYLTGKDLDSAVSLGAFFISTSEGVQKELARRKVVKKKTEEKAKFGQLLNAPVTCEFAKVPLNDAVAALAQLTKTRIVFDPAALQTEGRKAVVNAKFAAVRLEEVLEKILPPKLDYVVTEEGVITIVLKEAKAPAAPPPEKK